jgi:hypothetical protein
MKNSIRRANVTIKKLKIRVTTMVPMAHELTNSAPMGNACLKVTVHSQFRHFRISDFFLNQRIFRAKSVVARSKMGGHWGKCKIWDGSLH